MTDRFSRPRSRPWVIRTYSGHTSARASNELYRRNLAKGQTGLSIAFDLPTQTGYDADHPLARGEVGKVGVPIAHIGDMAVLLDGLPLDQMNTSMTINATAPWLLALYVAEAERRGIAPATLRGTTQNDIIKEYLSRGTYIFPPSPSMRLIVDTIAYAVDELPNWNPINVCSYHLQEAGATPVQEISYALASAIAVLDAVVESGQVSAAQLPQVVGRLSFFVNAGIRFVEECCKMRAFTLLWDEIAAQRYSVTDARLRRFRYGVQVNSLGLTEQQPENNVQRIILEMLGVTLSKHARARAVQLPAWNEAYGLPRPWDQQWSLRMQQVLIHESDLLEYGDLLDGSPEIQHTVEKMVEKVRLELYQVEQRGGMVAAVESGHVKRQLVRSQTERLRAIERGDLKVVGVNCFTETEPSPLTVGDRRTVLRVDPRAERDLVEQLRAHRKRRSAEHVDSALRMLKQAAVAGQNVLPASIQCAHAGVTTGEWATTLREVFGEYRAIPGIDIVSPAQGDQTAEKHLRELVHETSEALGRPIKLLIAKPGLDGHSNGAEQVAVKARDVGFEVVYEGIRLTPEQIVVSAQEEGVHLVGLSVLSGSHIQLVDAVLQGMKRVHIGQIPVLVGGIIPADDAEALRRLGVAAVYTPKDGDLNRIAMDMLAIVRRAHGLSVASGNAE